MFDPKQIDDLVKKLSSILPSSLNNFEKEIQEKFKEILQLALPHFDLINRKEFDTQVKVLARTREKVEELKLEIELLKNKFH